MSLRETHFCTRCWAKVQNVTLTWALLCAFVKMPGTALRKYPPHTCQHHIHYKRCTLAFLSYRTLSCSDSFSLKSVGLKHVMCIVCVFSVSPGQGAEKPASFIHSSLSRRRDTSLVIDRFHSDSEWLFFSLSLTRKFHSLQLFNRRLPSWVGPSFTHSTSFILYQRSHFDWAERDVNHPRLTLQRIVPPSNLRLNLRRSV